MLRRTSALAVGAITAGLSWTQVAAMPLAPMPQADDAAAAPLVLQIHGCHRSWLTDVYGTHRHSGPRCRRIDLGDYDYVPPPIYRRPVYRYECRYIGPIKQCTTVCR